MSLNIPILDVSQGFSDAAFIEKLSHACEEWGFFQVTGHGIDPALRNKFFQNVEDFFLLPKSEKMHLSRTENNFWGYYDKELTKNKVDSKEIYDIDANLDELNLQRPEFPVPWPDNLLELKPTVLQWLAEVESLSQNLLGSICTALGESSATLNPFFLKNHTSFLRFNYYPDAVHRSADEPEKENEQEHSAEPLGIHPHTDAGALTVLAQDDVPGLQVKKGDTWHTVMPTDGGFIINIGDMVQVWSNDRFKAPEHRVLASGEKARFSTPYFYNPSYETVCKPLVAKADESKYRPISWREFRSGRAAGDYADQGEEIQISWFRI
jgi:isopenicillin N synthase-like dioxygenase